MTFTHPLYFQPLAGIALKLTGKAVFDSKNTPKFWSKPRAATHGLRVRCSTDLIAVN
nr:hypothetical protein [uncultured bacterium]